jgi:hypothetical protein
MIEEYNAIVTDNNDPDKRGRIKVKSSGYLNSDEALPFWISPEFQFTDNTGGVFRMPSIGSGVIIRVPTESRWDEVQFEQSLQIEDNIRWKCIGFNDLHLIPEVFKTNYPDRSGEVWGDWVFFADVKAGELYSAYWPDPKSEPTLSIKITKNSINIDAGSSPVNISGSVVNAGDTLTQLQLVALSNKVDSNFSTLQAKFDGHKHPTAATGPPSTPDTLITNFPSTAASKVKAE